jgi:NADH:ubiquinone oxidoreductase subunit 5 (subunit L)/multisubunit Na+/H+ antiporter MnhA subunit
MYLLILFGSLFNLVFLGLFGRLLSTRLLFSVVIGSLFISFVACQLMFYEIIILRSPCEIPLFNWLQVSYLNVVWTLLFDTVSASLIYVVVFISLLVHLYSLDYMQNDPHIVRFLFCLSIFTFFMLIMASAGNVLQLFLG